MLFNLAHTFAVHCVNSFVPAFFKFCNDHLFDNLESEKRNYCVRKNSGKSLHPKFCANPVIGLLFWFSLTSAASQSIKTKQKMWPMFGAILTLYLVNN